MTEKKILDVTCGSRTIWFNKNHPAALYCDRRKETYTNVWKNDNGKAERKCVVNPDVLCDFTALPFDDNSFSLVIFDPPHLMKANETAWLVKKYSKLDENWPQMIHDGFLECMRVLKPVGTITYINEPHQYFIVDYITNTGAVIREAIKYQTLKCKGLIT